jgi:hypothetical protein
MDVVDAISELPTYQVYNAALQSIGSTVPLTGDVTQGVTRDNFVLFTSVEVLDIPEGDFDFDGDVDGADFLVWQRSIGSTTYLAADGNGNAIVDAADLALWSANYGATLPPPAAAVPEPAAAVLFLLGLLAKTQARGRAGRRG